jgi:hypothetical protein
MAWDGALTPEALWRGRGDSMARVWVIVIAYLAGAVLCLCAMRFDTAVPTVWFAAAFVLLLLALDRKLDFLAWVIARGRQIARSGGWYWSRRRVIQIAGTLVMGMTGSGLIAAIIWGMHGMAWRYRVACSATVYLFCLILLRAISLHEVDRLLYRKRRFLLGLPLNLVIEPVGIAVLASAAIAGCVG